MTRPRPLLIVLIVLGTACSSGSGEKRSGAVSTTASTAPATTSSTAPPSKCPDSVRTPQELGTPQNLADLQMVGPQKGFAVGKGTILVTDDGHTWTPRYTGAATFSAVNAVSAMHAWAVGDRTLYGTTDGGKTWKGRGNPDDGTVLRQVHFIDEHFGWGVGRGKLYRSGDGGATWGDLTPPCGAEAVCFTAQDDGWVAVGNRVYRSTSGGDSWTAVFTVPTGISGDWHPRAVQCTKGGVVWALFTGGSAAMSHSPYVLYRGTADGQWALVAKENMTAPDLPGAPELGTYPAPISLLDAGAAALLTWTPPADPPVGLQLATNGGRSLSPMRNIPGLSVPTAAAFVSEAAGWVLGTKTGSAPADVILATTDAGQTWQEQYARPAPK